jgi:hypothetical protein
MQSGHTSVNKQKLRIEQAEIQALSMLVKALPQLRESKTGAGCVYVLNEREKTLKPNRSTMYVSTFSAVNIMNIPLT